MLLLVLQLFSGRAATDSVNTFEQTFGRDNTFCSFKGKRVQIILRGHAKFTEQRDTLYGEYLFYQFDGMKPTLLELNKDHDHTYRIFLGTSPMCSKSHGYMIDDKTIAVLLLKENQPFEDKLVIQFFDAKTLTPRDFIETEYPTDKAKFTKTGFAFRTSSELHEPEIGKVTIQSESFIYQEKNFDYWVGYSKSGFAIDTALTYEKSSWAGMFKTKEDFLSTFGWNPTEKKFQRTVVFEAVNHKTHRKCLLVVEKKQKLEGNEGWICQAI